MSITELDAAEAYAKAWNNLDCTNFCELLSLDACYSSQWVFEELEGKDSIRTYLTNKMKAVKEGNLPVYAELTTATESYPGKYCVAMAQGNKNFIQSVVVFEVEGDFIKRYDMCIPSYFNIKRTHIYPK